MLALATSIIILKRDMESRAKDIKTLKPTHCANNFTSETVPQGSYLIEPKTICPTLLLQIYLPIKAKV